MCSVFISIMSIMRRSVRPAHTARWESSSRTPRVLRHSLAPLLLLLAALLVACAPASANVATIQQESAHSQGHGSASGKGAAGSSNAHASSAATPAPFGFNGTALTSPDGVSYVMYSGKAAAFDGLPLAADVTLPANAHGRLPLIVMVHGWGNSRTDWEATTVSGGSANKQDWNNVAFAARGYAVLTYTARGWHDSCGPDEASVPDNQATLPSACTSREYWVHLADPRWEIHDAQFLIATLVDEGVVDPERVGVTGGSYGGGHALLLALLNDRTMNADGSLSRWTSPKGIPLHIAAAVPEYTWASLVNSLLPNGRASDTSGADATLYANPVGVPIQSYVSGLYADGPVLRNGFYAPPQTDPSADLTTWYARVEAGNPYRDDPTTDPVVARAIAELNIRSPLSITPDANVPIFQVQGLTDPLFPPVQALLMRNRLLAWNALYPIKNFFGDVGHSYADNPADVWAAANAQGNAFVDYYLLHTGSAPRFDVTMLSTECVAGQTRLTLRAANWRSLASSTQAYTSSVPQATSNVAAGPEGAATDPIANSGCRSTQIYAGTGVASWTFPVGAPYVLAGQPTLTVNFIPAGVDAELNARLWDVSLDGQTETLVSRGTYRFTGTAGGATQVSYQISANCWQFQAGHTLRLEIVGNDAPYYQTSNVPATVAISSVSLALPTA